MKKYFILILIFLTYCRLHSQETKLQFGANVEFKDEFFLKPTKNIQYLEFHSLSINGLMRVSGNRFGLESSLGFEKSTNNFVRYIDNSSSFAYHNLDRLSISAMPYIFLMKREKARVDLGIGLKYYINLNSKLLEPVISNINLSKVSLKTALNYSKMNFQMGLFVEYDLQSDFDKLVTPFSFGFRFGYLAW